jgi:uncharacterized protein (TIGR01777 family)
MRALVTGATGFVGRRLLQDLDHPVVLSRDPERARKLLGDSADVFDWDPESGPPAASCFQGVDTVFHLAGEPIAAGRWNDERKARILDSRVLGTRHLVRALESLSERPAVLVSVSAVGFYGDRANQPLDETAGPGNDWLAAVCRGWESEADGAVPLKVRVVRARLGVVLGESGGALAKMLPPFRMGLGGRLGNGRQWMPWVHLDDVAGLLLHAAQNSEIKGAMNVVGPAAVNNLEFTRTLATVLGRPAFLPVPKVALQVLFGEMSTVLLASQRVLPRVAERTGYQYRYATLDAALRAILTAR